MQFFVINTCVLKKSFGSGNNNNKFTTKNNV